MTPNNPAWQDDLLEREVVLTRTVDAPQALLYSLWTNPEHLPQWFGPNGFTINTHEIDIRIGGCWRFDMVAPNGTCYTNRMVFTRLEPHSLLEADHGSDIDDDPNAFRLRVEFLPQSETRTIVVLRQLHPSPANRARVIGFGAVELGYQTLGKMAAYAAARL